MNYIRTTLEKDTSEYKSSTVFGCVASLLAAIAVVGQLLFFRDQLDSASILLMALAPQSLIFARNSDLKKASFPAAIVTAIAAVIIAALIFAGRSNPYFFAVLPFVFDAAASAALLVKYTK